MSDLPIIATCSNPIARVRKVREPFGILGNMSPHPIIDEFGVSWPRSEHLFQAMRFPAGSPIHELIRREKQPMQAKWLAKSHVDEMTVEPMSEADIANMRVVLLLKHAQHEAVRACLRETIGLTIIEDCTSRQRGSGLFWGAALRSEGWVGHNWLGRLWMELRAEVCE